MIFNSTTNITALDDDAKGPAKKLLTKWRPQLLEEQNVNGVQSEYNEHPAAATSLQQAPVAAGQ